jgi:CelD/BcsL family acetyltransferase involved in cellulose biosynthesis
MVRALVGALFQLPVRWDLFRLSNVLEDHPLLRSIGRALPPRRLAWCALRSGYASYFLDLPASFEDYLRQRTSKFRNHLRRTVRNIETVASARILIFTSPDDVDRAYRMLLEVEQASWKHDHGSAITAVSRQTGFFETVCRGAAVRGHLHLQLLVIEDRPVAYNLGFLREGCYFYLKTSYAVEHRALGVATYLRARLIEELIERRIRGFDFPAEPYEWERHWAERVRWHKVVTIHRGTPAGIVVAMADRIRHRSTARAVQYVDPRASRPGGAG